MTLANNLAKLNDAKQRNKRRRSDTLGTIMSIAEARAASEAARQQEAALAGGGATGAQSTALERLTPDAPSANPGSEMLSNQTDRLGNKGGFDKNFDASLKRLLGDFKGKVSVSSGYRSPQRQAQLWSAALKKYGSAAAARKWVAPPGKSNHGRGLAADLKYHGISPAAVHRAAAKYGLHFPLSNENWHIEPINARRKK